MNTCILLYDIILEHLSDAPLYFYIRDSEKKCFKITIGKNYIIFSDINYYTGKMFVEHFVDELKSHKLDGEFTSALVRFIDFCHN
jgi:hypothetical protein